MLRIVKLTAVAVVMLMSAQSLLATQNIVESGRANGSIYIPNNATKADQFAAEELQECIERMTGAKVPIVKSDEVNDLPSIVVGRHPFNAEAYKSLDAEYRNNSDAFSVVAKGGKLSVVGRSQTSTLWAAWHWLELQGIRWIMPGEHGSYYPKRDRLEIAALAVTETPGMVLRGPNYIDWNNPHMPEGFVALEHGIPANELFSLRMRMNENAGFVDADKFYRLGAGHSFSRYLPVSKYFSTNPEWYNLRNGARQNGKDSQLCFTNKESAREFAKNMHPDIKQLLDKGVPQARVRISVSPNDFHAVCECENCKQLLDSDGSATSQITNYANLVAGELHKTFPDVLVVFYAYDNYSTPPVHVKPGKKVFPELTAWTLGTSFAVNNAHPLMSNANKKFRDSFRKWSEISEKISVYTYYGHYNWFTPWPMTTQMAKDIPAMVADQNFYGMYSESHLHWGTQGMTFWLQPQLMWNPDLDVQAAIKDYCKAAYGPGSEAMVKYFQILQDAMDRQSYITGIIEEIPSLLTPSVVTACDKQIAELEGHLEGMDRDMRWRAELAIGGWRNSAKFAEAIRLYLGGNRADRDRILELCREVEQFSQTKLGEWAFQYRMAKPGFDLITSALSTSLTALPQGKTVYKNAFNSGGALSFFADVSGFDVGVWGYSLPVNGKGTVALPLSAKDDGQQIASAKVKWTFAGSENLVAELVVVEDDGKEKLLSNDIKAIGSGIDIPASMPHDQVQLKLTVGNQSHNPVIALVGFQIEVLVE